MAALIAMPPEETTWSSASPTDLLEALCAALTVVIAET